MIVTQGPTSPVLGAATGQGHVCVLSAPPLPPSHPLGSGRFPETWELPEAMGSPSAPPSGPGWVSTVYIPWQGPWSHRKASLALADPCPALPCSCAPSPALPGGQTLVLHTQAHHAPARHTLGAPLPWRVPGRPPRAVPTPTSTPLPGLLGVPLASGPGLLRSHPRLGAVLRPLSAPGQPLGEPQGRAVRVGASQPCIRVPPILVPRAQGLTPLCPICPFLPSPHSLCPGRGPGLWVSRLGKASQGGP